jgi:hypothetical protein
VTDPRRGHRPNRPALLAGLAALAAVAGCGPEEGGEPLRVASDRLGHVFAPTEPVVFRLEGPGSRKSWELRDWTGAVLARGVTGYFDPDRVSLPLNRLGYFELRVAAPGAPGAAAVTTAFARLPAATRRDGSPFGVMAHFAQGWGTDIVPLIARIGLGHVRDEQYWAEVEREPGELAFPGSYVAYMEALRAHGARPLLEMTFANPLHDGGLTPFSPAGQEAFARYGVGLLERYGDQLEAIEVWNEINGTWCDGPCREDRAGVHAGMLASTWRALKARRPGVRVVGGAAAGIPVPWFRKLAALGALDHLDAVAAHAYPREPEDDEPAVTALTALLRAAVPARPVPIWITETGNGAASEAGRRAAATWLTRQLTLLRAAGVERVYWYLLRDHGEFQGFGLLREPDSGYGRYAPNPAYAAYAALIRELDGAAFVRRERTDPRTRAYLFSRDGQPVRVLWSTAGRARLDVRAVEPLALVDLMGNAAALAPAGGWASVELGEAPQYLIGRAALEGEHRDDRYAADSRLDYGTRQGGGGWSYGYVRADAQAASSGFRTLEAAENDWTEAWGLAGEAALAIDRDSAHPAGDGSRQLWCVRRWRSTVSGRVRLTGTLARPAPGGDGTVADVAVDGRELGRWQLPPGARTDYTLEVEVRPGSLIDLVVTPGPAGDDLFDATLTTMTIAALPGAVRSAGGP